MTSMTDEEWKKRYGYSALAEMLHARAGTDQAIM